ncbi:hypothetical protein [Pseudomonas tussilaginis]|uniref:hypothetical protein n=1 Tax=Pseudomonas putida TaxID=303 RepID=UPI002363522F|nr:hypothetical protein [Pseudomonas putida]MDD1979005.1 hypothetical protein [Pseudomonas putida]
MIELAIAARLGALAGGSVYPGKAPEDAPSPRITFFVVDAQTGWVLSGWDGSQVANLQVDCWATSKVKAIQLAGEAFTAMAESDAEFSVSAAQRLPDDYEDSTQLHRVTWEYTLQP